MKQLSNYVFICVIALLLSNVFVTHATAQDNQSEKYAAEASTTMKVRITANGKTTIFVLNDSQAARNLLTQLPLSIKIEDYSDNEKIFYPPKRLGTSDTPLADAQAGTLAYYAPWGDVVMFYNNFGSASGLYELGYAVSGKEHISGMTGIILIEKE